MENEGTNILVWIKYHLLTEQQYEKGTHVYLRSYTKGTSAPLLAVVFGRLLSCSVRVHLEKGTCKQMEIFFLN